MMKPSKKFRIQLLVALAMCIAAVSAGAQATSDAKPVEKHFEVLHMFITTIQVRNPDDMRELRTFIYSDQIRDEMQALFNSGNGYQYGDKVRIVFRPGTEIALKIKGKPSKSR